MSIKTASIVVAVSIVFAGMPLPLYAQKAKQVIPHGQDSEPGAPVTPAQAVAKMTVPDGFAVEVVAAEPDIVNPVAMTFDERGRIWITESVEYPRKSAGPGRDRVKVLESTHGDGKYDKITVFTEGLNIPSGIAVGYGGIWVANAPDLLFYKEGADGKAAGKPEVVVTGFGRADTHELPNSLTWGPDGWLYGLNGVFNQSRIKHRGKELVFTCALFRIQPRTREFQLFAEGTSNPWGLAWDTEGSAFVSACVIDHLWHLTETGYYHRQGGPYPPFTWKIGSIVGHKHQKAAYCGLNFFDSDAYPPEYREKLYMGNIHGSCVNSDVLSRDGSTYFAKPCPDFLTANDAWFMPVSLKSGPDGCLYILDWYDRYHCYQDANRDPDGIDRERGRLYRVRYKNTPPVGKFDLAKETDDQLIERLHSPNVYFRDLAQRLLCERNAPEARSKLWRLVRDDAKPRKARMHALWALVGMGELEECFHHDLLKDKDPAYRAWGVRAAGNIGTVAPLIRRQVAALARDPSADVRLQVAIAARKIEGLDPLGLLGEVLAHCGQDKLIPPIVWQNLHPLLEERAQEFIAIIQKMDLKGFSAPAMVVPRAMERLLAARNAEAEVVNLLTVLTDDKNTNEAVLRQCLALLATKVQVGEIAGTRLEGFRPLLQPALSGLLAGEPNNALHQEAVLLAATLGYRGSVKAAQEMLASPRRSEAARLKALSALVAAGDTELLDSVASLLADTRSHSARFRGQVVAALSRFDDVRVADVVLAHYAQMEADLQPRAIELLTQRTSWSKRLLAEIANKKIPTGALNVNQVRKLLASKDTDLIKQVTAVWGTVRDGRNPERERVVAEMRELLQKTRGDPRAGMVVFNNVCAQCHKMYGAGQDVGPDITSNGRSDFEQLLSNVFDPSLVIGAGYVATTVATKKGQIITGLLAEDNPQRVVFKVQGGKLETIPRADIEDIAVSKVSLMPEQLEKQLKPQEIADLFAFLCLDKPPSDPTAKHIPGTPNVTK